MNGPSRLGQSDNGREITCFMSRTDAVGLPSSSNDGTSQKTRVLIVDDHSLVRDGLRMQISSHDEFEVCGETGSEPEALRLVRELCPHIVIIDLSLKDGNGIDLIKRLASHDCPPKMLVSSMHDEEIYAERAVHAGARGYVHKQQASLEIIEALRQIRDGHFFLSTSVMERLMSRVAGGTGDAPVSPIQRLTDRELEVFELLGRGLSVLEIGKSLKISHKTVETYRDRIRKKLGVENARLLVRYAVKWVTEHTTE